VEWLKVHETRHEVEPVGSSERDDDVSESSVSTDQVTERGKERNQLQLKRDSRRVLFPSSQYVRPPSSSLWHRGIDRPSSTVEQHKLKNGKEDHGAGEEHWKKEEGGERRVERKE